MDKTSKILEDEEVLQKKEKEDNQMRKKVDFFERKIAEKMKQATARTPSKKRKKLNFDKMTPG